MLFDPAGEGGYGRGVGTRGVSPRLRGRIIASAQFRITGTVEPRWFDSGSGPIVSSISPGLFNQPRTISTGERAVAWILDEDSLRFK
jgi:hypothetical protein